MDKKSFTWRPDAQTFEAANDMAQEENLSINQYVTRAVRNQAASDIVEHSLKRLKDKQAKRTQHLTKSKKK